MNNHLKEVEVIHPAIGLKINNSYRDNMSAEDLYNATRYCWRVSKDRASKAVYAFAIVNRIIKEVYKISEWVEADKQKKFLFIGDIAEPEIRNLYLDGSLNNYFRRGEANSFKYFLI